ncbi:uncharacterized protein LOC141617850 [Silene latifolia]|uniref:uncharacterized protein LOC141617850 n=1 Tax=Silene latifolia TaxID=37657 RepID=UPI003D78A797
MEPNESFDSMSARFYSIINELENVGRKCESEDIARKVLRSLTKKWCPKVTTMEESRDLTSLSYQELIGALMAHEIVLDKDDAEPSKNKCMALQASENEKVESGIEDETVIISSRSEYCLLGESDSENEEEEVSYLELKKQVKKLPKSTLIEYFEQSLDKCHEQDLELKDLKEQILDIAEENHLQKVKELLKSEATTREAKISDQKKEIDSLNQQLKEFKTLLSDTKKLYSEMVRVLNKRFQDFRDNYKENNPSKDEELDHFKCLKEIQSLKDLLLHARKVVVKENNQWYHDSGCSRHMTGDISLFISLEPFDGGKVTFGDNKKGKVIGIGKIGISTSHAFSDVYLVKGLKHKVVFHSDICRIIIEGTSSVILEGHHKRNVYMIDLNASSTNSFTCMKATLDDPCLWRKRFAHISSRILNKVKKWDLVEGFPSFKFD